MWSTLLVFLTGVSALVLPNISAVRTSAIDRQRDIIGLLGGDIDGSDTPLLSNQLSTRPVLSLSKGSTKTPTNPAADATPPASRSSANQPTSAVPTSAKPADRTTYPHSSIETTALSNSTVPVSAATQTSDHTSKTWQVVGIVFISILFIATSITCAMFFDRLWRFFRDVFCGKARSEASEEFIPDSQSQSWDMSTPSPSLSDLQCKGESLGEKPSANTRELPWNTDSQTWNTLHRQPSRRIDHRAIS